MLLRLRVVMVRTKYMIRKRWLARVYSFTLVAFFFALQDFSVNIQQLTEKTLKLVIFNFQFFRMFFMRTSGLWRMHQCVQTAIISLRFIIVMPLFLWFTFLYLLRGPWSTVITTTLLLEYFHKISVLLTWLGREIIIKKNPSLDSFFFFFFQALSEASKFFPTYSLEMVYFWHAISNCVSENFLYVLFFLKFWINKWMRTMTVHPVQFHLCTFLWCNVCVVWNVIRRTRSLRMPAWRVLQLVQHRLNEGLQKRYQSVSWGQAARWGHMDEGCSPFTVIQWAVIGKITQVPEEDIKYYLIFLSVIKLSAGTDVYLPASLE